MKKEMERFLGFQNNMEKITHNFLPKGSQSFTVDARNGINADSINFGLTPKTRQILADAHLNLEEIQGKWFTILQLNN